jgi:hypothetical protein
MSFVVRSTRIQDAVQIPGAGPESCPEGWAQVTAFLIGEFWTLTMQTHQEPRRREYGVKILRREGNYSLFGQPVYQFSVQASPGEWLVRDGNEIIVLSDAEFRRQFEVI